MTRPVVESLMVLVAMVGIYALAFGLFRRRDPERAAFARLRMSKWSGPNAGVILSALAVSQLYYSLSSDQSSTIALWGFMAAVGAIFIVVGLHDRGERLVELVGVVAFVLVVFVNEGVESGMAYLTAAIALLISLSLARFLFGR